MPIFNKSCPFHDMEILAALKMFVDDLGFFSNLRDVAYVWKCITCRHTCSHGNSLWNDKSNLKINRFQHVWFFYVFLSCDLSAHDLRDNCHANDLVSRRCDATRKLLKAVQGRPWLHFSGWISSTCRRKQAHCSLIPTLLPSSLSLPFSLFLSKFLCILLCFSLVIPGTLFAGGNYTW